MFARPERLAAPQWLALIALSAVAVALRAVFVGDQSIGYEEVFTSSIVAHSTLGGVWRAISASESTPPLYYALTWGWVKLAGSQAVVQLRMTSLLAGAVTAPVAFFALRRFVADRAALAAAWLCAISPLLVEYSIYARSYALMVLVATLSLWALGALVERPSWRRWAVWALAAAVCLWTHYFTAYLLAGEVAVLVVVLPGSRRRLLAALAFVAALSAPLWPLFVSQSGASERTAYIAAEPLGGRIEGIVRQLAMGANVPNKWLEGAGIALAAAAALFALWRLRREPAGRALALVALAGAGLPVLAALSGVDDHLLPRNVIGVWAAVAALAAYGLLRWRAVPLALYSALCLVTVLAVQLDWRYQASPDWQRASALVATRAAGDPIAVMPGIESNVAAYYLHRPPLRAPLRTADLWVMVGPARGPHQRALAAVASPPLGALWGAAFRVAGEIDYRGFRLIHLQASVPALVTPAPANDGSPSAPLAALLGR